MTFYKKARCEVLQPSGQWHPGTIDNGPYVGDNGAAFYRVHFTIQLIDTIWYGRPVFVPTPTTQLHVRTATFITLNQSVPRVHAVSQTKPTPVSALRQSAIQSEGSLSGSSRPMTSSAPTLQPVVPLKRPLEQEHQAVAPTQSAQIAHPAPLNAVSIFSLA